jgi:hypothetical protein
MNFRERCWIPKKANNVLFILQMEPVKPYETSSLNMAKDRNNSTTIHNTGPNASLLHRQIIGF